MLLNTETKASSIREIFLLEFSILDLESSFEDLVSLISSDGDMDSDFFITLDVEASNSVTSAGWDGFLSREVLKNLACFII